MTHPFSSDLVGPEKNPFKKTSYGNRKDLRKLSFPEIFSYYEIDDVPWIVNYPNLSYRFEVGASCPVALVNVR